MSARAEQPANVPSDRAVGSMSRGGLFQALPIALRDMAYVLLALFALVSALLLIRAGFRDDTIGFDFRGTLWDAALAIREGRSPYPAPLVDEVDVGSPAVYPPFLMLLIVPLTLVPWWLGLTIWSALQVGSLVGALAILRVRDPRCYALALLSVPAIRGFEWGNAALLLVPLVALAWRWRDEWWRAGIAVGIGIGAKLFMWPLLVWLLATRRYRAAGAAALASALVIVLPWAAIGFDGFSSYPDLLRTAEGIYATHSFSIATALAGLGVADVASSGALAVGVAVAGAGFYLGRRGNDEASLAVVVLASIFGSPIVWEYYYALLIVPLAIVRPRFSSVWMLLPLFYVTQRLPRELLASTELEPGGAACCRPDDVPMASWLFTHAPPALWPALGHALLASAIVASLVWATGRDRRRSGEVLGG